MYLGSRVLQSEIRSDSLNIFHTRSRVKSLHHPSRAILSRHCAHGCSERTPAAKTRDSFHLGSLRNELYFIYWQFERIHAATSQERSMRS